MVAGGSGYGISGGYCGLCNGRLHGGVYYMLMYCAGAVLDGLDSRQVFFWSKYIGLCGVCGVGLVGEWWVSGVVVGDLLGR